MKKTLSLILALLMSASCASYIFADDAAIADEAEVEATAAIEDEAVVEDEEEATPYDRAIRFLNTYGVMHGYEDGLLHAENAVERYQMALFTGRIATGWVEDDTWEDFDANDSGFNDLKGTAAENVYGAMSYVSQKGIIEGYEDGSFRPEQTVTYREALTMAVRTLGYQGLEYPWGYIEKAVSLGLTDGITDVAYTDTINRGVAAQIIYNTMLAEDSKLALKNFNVAFGWKDIVITDSVINDSTHAPYTVGDFKTPSTKYVAFQLRNADGTLDSDIYYTTTASLGLDETKHEDELAIGTPYSVLFSQDSKDNLVDIIDYEAYEATVVTNNGRTDDEGVAYDTVDNIKAYLADYTLVDKYSSKVLANTGKLHNEIIVKQADTLTTTKFEYNKNPYVFDWETGDILVAEQDEDGNYVTVKDDKGNVVKDEYGNVTYKNYVVAWHYDAEFDRYFSIKTEVNKNGTSTVVGIDILDENDVAEIRKAITEACTTTVAVKGYGAADVDGSIYATLNSYEDLAYATYENYDYGYISYDKAYLCSASWHYGKVLTINGSTVGALEDCGSGSNHTDAIWWQDDYAPVTDEDGNIVGAYVIYGYNNTTKELKVLKTIEAYSEDLVDADTYYATGVLRGYSISKGYVVIGDEKIYFNEDFGTFDLDQDNNNYKDGAYKSYLSDVFDGLFGQFVRYYVLDGKVVEIETVGNTTSNYIVVDSYAGISNDGYIVVNGYSTDDLKYDRFRIASYDGWDEGDFFWYGSQIDGEFVKGNVYQITSYDAENDLYYVSAIGEVEKNGTVTSINTNAKTGTIEIETGYRVYSDSEGKSSTKKVKSSDKYIIIGEGKDGYMPIAVFEGKAQDGWKVSGNILVGGKDATTFIIVNATVKGFNADAWNNAGLVMIVSNKVLDRFYDGADTEDWYLNGATEYSNILAFNFYTGAFEYVTSSTNKKPAVGAIYKTVDGVLGETLAATNFVDDVLAEMIETYTDGNVDVWHLGHGTATETSDYVFGKVELTSAYWDANNSAFVKGTLSTNDVKHIFGITANATDLVNSVKVVEINYDSNGNFDGVSSYNYKSWKNDVADGLSSVTAWAVYGINEDGTVNAVLYIDDATKNGSITADEEVKATTDNYVEIVGNVVNKTEAGVQATITADETTTTVNGVATTTYAVNSLTVAWVGDFATESTHATLKAEGYNFGEKDLCFNNGWTAYANGEAVTDAHVSATTYKATNDCGCELVNAVTVTFNEAVVVGADGENMAICFNTVIDGVECNCFFTVSADIVKGELVVEFANNGMNWINVEIVE